MPITKPFYLFLERIILLYLVDIMKLNIIEEEAKSMIIEFDGTDRAIPELLKDKLMQNKDVEFASVMKTHPEIGQPRLVVKSGKNAKSLVLKALEDVEEDIKELSSQMNKK